MKLWVITDVQNDFNTGALGSKEAQAAIPFIEKCVGVAKDNGDKVVYTRDTHDDDYFNTQEGRLLPVEHCKRGTWGWQVVDRVRLLEGEHVRYVDKDRFGYTDWESVIDALDGCDEVIIIGFCTDICVIVNALMIKTLYPEMPITVLAGGCAGTTPEKHEMALNVMRSCQINVE